VWGFLGHDKAFLSVLIFLDDMAGQAGRQALKPAGGRNGGRMLLGQEMLTMLHLQIR